MAEDSQKRQNILKRIAAIERYQKENDCNCGETERLGLLDRLKKMDDN